MATSAWLEITFQVGLGIAALVGGKLIARDAYFTLGLLSAVSMAVLFMLTFIFFRHKEKAADAVPPKSNEQFLKIPVFINPENPLLAHLF